MCLNCLGFGRSGIRGDSFASEYQRRNYGGETPRGGTFAYAQSSGTKSSGKCYFVLMVLITLIIGVPIWTYNQEIGEFFQNCGKEACCVLPFTILVVIFLIILIIFMYVICISAKFCCAGAILVILIIIYSIVVNIMKNNGQLGCLNTIIVGRGNNTVTNITSNGNYTFEMWLYKNENISIIRVHWT